MSSIYLPEVAVTRIMSGDSDLLADGLSRGLKPSILWPMWDAPLLHGVCFFSPPRAALMAKSILEAGETMASEWKGLTPLLCAVSGFNSKNGDELGVRLELVSLLATQTTSQDVLMATRLAVKRGYKEAVEVFLGNGMNVNTPYPDGSTLLHEAYFQADKEMCEFLIQHGSDPYLADHQGAIPARALPPSLPTHEKDAFVLDVESKSAQGLASAKAHRL